MRTTPTRRWLILVSIAVAVALPIAVAIPYLQTLFPDPPEQIEQPPAMTMQSNHPFWNSPFIMPGVDHPPIVARNEADFDNDEEVIGVDVQGKHRAYRIAALARPPHVANDVIGRVPVTVTFCPNSDMVQTFTSERVGKPLPISLGGWSRGTMVLKYESRFFVQQTGRNYNPELPEELPFTTCPHRRTTWKKWCDSWPDTDVCLTLSR
jgi:Protein of unknown function (DUF3179)